MEIEYRQDKGYIAVWLTNAEQKLYDRSRLTSLLLNGEKSSKCKVVFFLSGNDGLYGNTEGLLLMNLKSG